MSWWTTESISRAGSCMLPVNPVTVGSTALQVCRQFVMDGRWELGRKDIDNGLREACLTDGDELASE